MTPSATDLVAGAPLMDWHRQFGLILTDLFADSPFTVELEKDLSLKQQFLDVVVLRKGPGEFDGELPDGLEDLAPHNLITFKSYQEALDDWALKELTGHYVNYRKQVSPAKGALLPERDFRLLAVCARFPHNLASEAGLAEVRPGVFECRRGSDVIRVLVAGQLPRREANAPLHVFSSDGQVVLYGAAHFRQRSPDTSTLLLQLLSSYRGEGFPMPYTMEDFRKDFRKNFVKEMTPEERKEVIRELLTPEERKEVVRELTAQERKEVVRELTPQERKEVVKELTPEERKEVVRELTPEERLDGLSAEQLLRHLSRAEIEEQLRRANDHPGAEPTSDPTPLP